MQFSYTFTSTYTVNRYIKEELSDDVKVELCVLDVSTTTNEFPMPFFDVLKGPGSIPATLPPGYLQLVRGYLTPETTVPS